MSYESMLDDRVTVERVTDVGTRPSGEQVRTFSVAALDVPCSIQSRGSSALWLDPGQTKAGYRTGYFLASQALMIGDRIVSARGTFEVVAIEIIRGRTQEVTLREHAVVGAM